MIKADYKLEKAIKQVMIDRAKDKISQLMDEKEAQHLPLELEVEDVTQVLAAVLKIDAYTPDELLAALFS